MTRKQQVSAALDQLAPKHHRAECKAEIERALDMVEAAGRAVEHAKITRKSMRTYSLALRRMALASKAHAAAGGALALPRHVIENAVLLDRTWSAHWSPPSRSLKKQTAIKLAYELLSHWSSQPITTSRNRAWHELAGILLGDRKANLFRQLRAVAEIRSRRK